MVEDTLAGGKLSKTAKANFRGGAFGGDPTYIPGEKTAAPGNGQDMGVLWPWHHSVDGLTAKNSSGKKVELVRSYCYANDFFCQQGTSMKVHNSYALSPTANSMEKWLRQFG